MDHGLVSGDQIDGVELDALRKECRQLREETERLRSLLDQHGICSTSPRTVQRPVDPVPSKAKLTTSEKVALFRSLFGGREAVYAQTWESPDGRSGYSPKTER